MERAEFYQMVEEITGADSGSINDDTVLKGLEGWDSLAIVQFVATVDERLGVIIPVKQITTCITMSDLAKIFSDKVH